MALSREALERQVKDLNAEFLLYRKGQLRLYEQKRNFDRSSILWDACSRYNIQHTLFNSVEEINEIQPGLIQNIDMLGLLQIGSMFLTLIFGFSILKIYH